MRHGIFILFSRNEQRWGGEGGELPDFLFCSLFPVQQTTCGIDHRVDGVVFRVVSNQYAECVRCVFSSHLFWTSDFLDVPAGVTQEEGHTGLLILLPSAVHALIFIARRIQPLLSLVDREVDFCVLTI